MQQDQEELAQEGIIDLVDLEQEVEEEIVEMLHLLKKKNQQKQKSKSRLGKLLRNYKGNLLEEKVQNTEEIKEMLTGSIQKQN